MKVPCGVYIGKDFEAVFTEKYSIVFRRNTKADFLESMLLDRDFKCIGLCRTAPCGSKTNFEPDKWEYALKGDKSVFSGADIINSMDSLEISINESNGNLVTTYYDGETYDAKTDESLTREDLTPKCYFTSEEPISRCLLTWNVGCDEITWNNEYCGVSINTYKHMYIFEITENSVYCRAARYKTCDKGVVFNQNFRQGVVAYMLENNFEAMNELELDENLFNAEACFWNGPSVYWSVSEVKEDYIVLNGCQGDKYVWSKSR